MSPAELFQRLDLWPALLAAPALLALLAAVERRRRRTLEGIVSAERQRALCAEVSRPARRRAAACAAAAVACAALAAMRPVLGEEVRAVEQRGVDLLVCLDVSRSMLARDLEPSRLERARREIQALADRLAGDRIGLVAFAGDAKLAIPLTHDTDTFRGLLQAVDTATVRRGGTDLGRAIEAALTALAAATGDHEAILLLTDGEDLEGQGLAAAKKAAARGIAIHAVGFGSTRGSKIAVEGEGEERFLKDDSGAEVVSSMDPESLRRIAAETGGEFLRADAVPLPLIELYDKRISAKVKKIYEAEERREKRQRFQWPLAAGVLLGLAALATTGRRGGPP